MENPEILSSHLVWLKQLEQDLKERTSQIQSFHKMVSQPSYKKITDQQKVNEDQQAQPGFYLNQQLGTFVTQTQLFENQYKKIRYQPRSVQLNTKTLIITDSKTKTRTELSLQSIYEVNYFEKQKLQLKMRDQLQDEWSVFLSFESLEKMKKWDLAVFINYKIIKSRGKGRLFENQMLSEDSQLYSPLLKHHKQKKCRITKASTSDTFQDPMKKSNRSLRENIILKPQLPPSKPTNPKDLLNNAKINLKTGYNLTKYAEGGFNPHEKKVYLSGDELNLCTYSADKPNSVKKYRISEIQHAMYKKIGTGIKKHVKEIRSECFGIIITLDKDVELGSQNPLIVEQFFTNLNFFINMRKRT